MVEREVTTPVVVLEVPGDSRAGIVIDNDDFDQPVLRAAARFFDQSGGGEPGGSEVVRERTWTKAGGSGEPSMPGGRRRPALSNDDSPSR